MSTITDVARAAGVSVATVSRALRGLDKVNPETRARVRRVAAELEYVASPTAASLASGRTRVIGVVAPFLTRWFFSTLVSGIEKTLRQYGHHVLLFDLEDASFDRRMRLTQSMLWKRVDGVIVLNIPMDEQEQALIERLDLPVVTVGNRVGHWPCVRIDDRAAMAMATDHVLDLGHTEIAYVGAVPTQSAHLQTPQDRREAFAEALAARGLRCPDEWVVESDWTAAGARRDAQPLLTGPRRPTAVVAASDEMAFGVVALARRLGLQVPLDLTVVGVDDHEMSDVLDLTTVRQDVDAQGRRAGEILIRQLLDEDSSPPLATTLPVELVVRGSAGPPPATSRTTPGRDHAEPPGQTPLRAR
jgi:DNA-binding LacI/PurR family transcriptional regulator